MGMTSHSAERKRISSGSGKSWFEVKVRAMLGMDKRDDKEITILGRIVRWTSKGIEYEADPRHRTKVMEYFGLAQVGGLSFHFFTWRPDICLCSRTISRKVTTGKMGYDQLRRNESIL